ncbi:MAG: arylsulfatase [Microthrixaceae bacterium]
MSDDGDPTAPYAGHPGPVGRVYATSEPWWPPRPTAGEGAPNIIVMMADDLGFADLGCYGSEIPTPNLDAVASGGAQYTDYHSYPMCSPTRAALLTGLEPHRAGIGHVAHSDPGFPGYSMTLSEQAPTIAELLRAGGYQTLMVGKWHLTKDSEQNDAADRSSWPCQRGFDRYYGFLDAFTNFHHPHRRIEDNHAVRTDTYPEGYFLTDDFTDRAVSMIRESKASKPDKPFFMYFSHAAMHAPIQAKAADIAAHRGRYDDGWDEVRDARFARQKELGLIPEDAVLPPRNAEEGDDVPAWDDLDREHRRLYARYMETYAGLLTNLDDNVGRLRAALEEMGEWDNTLFVFTSDNGGSREGEAAGTTAYFRSLHFGRVGHEEPFEEDYARLEEVGGPTNLPHYPRGWAMVSNTPFRLYKINTHRGGHSVPFLASWPDAGVAGGELRNAYVHVTDLFPTMLEVAGLQRPDEWNGAPALETIGNSMLDTLTDASAEGHQGEVMMECEGNRSFRRDNWEAVARHPIRTPFAEDRWELFDVSADPTQVNDLAAVQPEVLAELKALWDASAWDNQVFPLDEGTGLKFLIRPPWNEVFSEPVVMYPGQPTLERWRSLQLILWRSFDVTASVTLAEGDSGILFAHGDQGGGYSLYVDDTGELVAAHNGYGLEGEVRGPLLDPGEHELTLSVEAPGKDCWNIALSVDGERVASGEGFRLLMAMAPFEGIDIGMDRRSPVCWSVHERHGAFAFTGDLHRVSYQPGEAAPDAPSTMIDFLRDWGKSFE